MTREVRPPSLFGDPNAEGYWTADVGGVDDDVLESIGVAGDTIRFMWDYGVTVPLWDATGHLPEEPSWLRGALGLDEALVEDLVAWGGAMNELDAQPPSRAQWRATYAEMDNRARGLVTRLEQRLGLRFAVEYRPW